MTAALAFLTGRTVSVFSPATSVSLPTSRGTKRWKWPVYSTVNSHEPLAVSRATTEPPLPLPQPWSTVTR